MICYKKFVSEIICYVNLKDTLKKYLDTLSIADFENYRINFSDGYILYISSNLLWSNSPSHRLRALFPNSSVLMRFFVEQSRRSRGNKVERDVAGWLLSSRIRVHWHFGARAIPSCFVRKRSNNSIADDDENNGEEDSNEEEEEDDDAFTRTCTVRAETWRSLANGFDPVCVSAVSGISPHRTWKHSRYLCICIYIYTWYSSNVRMQDNLAENPRVI